MNDVIVQVRMRTSVVAFVLLVGISLFKVNASELSSNRMIDRPNVKPLVKERFSINSNGSSESVVSREVINHVRHQHQQTIGNVHVLTNIDIANLITILNASVPTVGQPTDATSTPGKIVKESIFSNHDFITNSVCVRRWIVLEAYI